jgi:hypothetical protein
MRPIIFKHISRDPQHRDLIQKHELEWERAAKRLEQQARANKIKIYDQVERRKFTSQQRSHFVDSIIATTWGGKIEPWEPYSDMHDFIKNGPIPVVMRTLQELGNRYKALYVENQDIRKEVLREADRRANLRWNDKHNQLLRTNSRLEKEIKERDKQLLNREKVINQIKSIVISREDEIKDWQEKVRKERLKNAALKEGILDLEGKYDDLWNKNVEFKYDEEKGMQMEKNVEELEVEVAFLKVMLNEKTGLWNTEKFKAAGDEADLKAAYRTALKAQKNAEASEARATTALKKYKQQAEVESRLAKEAIEGLKARNVLLKWGTLLVLVSTTILFIIEHLLLNG